MHHRDILSTLRETSPEALADLWKRADAVRREAVGPDVHLRGLLEISSHCARSCLYCGLRAENKGLTRYRMTREEILACLKEIAGAGYGTVVLQSGEDPALNIDWMAGLIQDIKSSSRLAVTLSLGEQSDAALEAWREAGADRYLLRFETSHAGLYGRIHPPRKGSGASDRLRILRKLMALGYETGSGVMVGIPGQTHEMLAADIALFRDLGLHMVGVGPFIPHPDTPLGGAPASDTADQVPPTDLMVFKAMALTRILCPGTNIPVTTALSTINQEKGRELGLRRGGNVIMPNFTPLKFRASYAIYPEKACIRDSGIESDRKVRELIKRVGRQAGTGRGDAPAMKDGPNRNSNQR